MRGNEQGCLLECLCSDFLHFLLAPTLCDKVEVLMSLPTECCRTSITRLFRRWRVMIKVVFMNACAAILHCETLFLFVFPLCACVCVL